MGKNSAIRKQEKKLERGSEKWNNDRDDLSHFLRTPDINNGDPLVRNTH
jgi:hypothetical protein